MIIVSNTSPLTNLAAVGQFHLLHKLYQELHIATGVWDELNAQGHRWPGSAEVSAAAWISRHEVKNQALVQALMQDIDRGEAETIALAIELNADLVIIDEKAGRQRANQMGLNVAGVLGLLLQAKNRGLIAEVRPVMDALRQAANFHISRVVYSQIASLAGE